MRFETERIRVPLWVILTGAIVIVIVILGYWYYLIDPNSVKLLGLVGALAAGLIVYLATFLTLL